MCSASLSQAKLGAEEGGKARRPCTDRQGDVYRALPLACGIARTPRSRTLLWPVGTGRGALWPEFRRVSHPSGRGTFRFRLARPRGPGGVSPSLPAVPGRPDVQACDSEFSSIGHATATRDRRACWSGPSPWLPLSALTLALTRPRQRAMSNPQPVWARVPSNRRVPALLGALLVFVVVVLAPSSSRAPAAEHLQRLSDLSGFSSFTRPAAPTTPRVWASTQPGLVQKHFAAPFADHRATFIHAVVQRENETYRTPDATWERLVVAPLHIESASQPCAFSAPARSRLRS